MAQILHIDVSPRAERSHSRQLSSKFIETWKAKHPQDTILYRDLGHELIPYLDEKWIAAAFSPPKEHTPELQQAIALSDLLIDEFKASDRFVFSIPMYNFTIPAVFKSYIDQIVRVNRTFVIEEDEYKGLVKGKKMLIITTRGGNYKEGTPTAVYDFQEPYLRTIFAYIGITDITFVHAENLNMGLETRTESLAEAEKALKEMTVNW